MWSDGAIIWVAQDGDFDKIYAYDLASGAHRPDRDIDTIDDAGNDSPRGVWSDGTTMWVADGYDRKMFAYDLASGARRPDRDIDTLDDAGNGSPTGVWSDGTTMWVIDDYDNKIYAYELASASCAITGTGVQHARRRMAPRHPTPPSWSDPASTMPASRGACR